MTTSANKMVRSAALASLGVALLLGALKGWAVWRTNSAAMLGSLGDTALDLLASLITLAGVWIAARPADQSHRFGHGKAEALAALAQIALICVSAIAIGWRSVVMWQQGVTSQAAADGIFVSIAAILCTLALVAWQRRVVARTGSIAIATDSMHYQSDLLLNLAVIAALVLEQYWGVAGADPAFGLAIAVWLLWNARSAAEGALDHLMDREWPEDKRRAFVERAATHPELARLHDLRTRTSGMRDFVQFHVDLPPDMTVAEAHAIVERVEADLMAGFPGIELLIHIDPAGHVDDPGNALVEESEFSKLGARP